MFVTYEFPNLQLLQEYKKDFDSLNYIEKLRFWDEKELRCEYSYAIKEEADHVNGIEGSRDFLTIIPQNKEEKFYYNEWIYEKAKKEYQCNLDSLIEKFEIKVEEEDANEFEYAKSEIDLIESYYANDKELKLKNFKTISLGYETSITGDRKFLFETKFFEYDEICRFRRGFTLEKYVRFLKDRIKEIESGTLVKKGKTFKWIGTKTELSELIYALYLNNKINNGTSAVTLKELKETFEILFNVSISDINNLLRPALTTYKRAGKRGENFFTYKLLQSILNFKEEQ